MKYSNSRTFQNIRGSVRTVIASIEFSRKNNFRVVDMSVLRRVNNLLNLPFMMECAGIDDL